MAIPKNGLIISALLLTLAILETGHFSRQALTVPVEEEHFLPHTREKRSEPTGQWNYIIEIVVNASSLETFARTQSILNATSFPIQLDNNTEISGISFTTVCSSTDSGFQCRCEEQFAWPHSSCVTNRACDDIVDGMCRCIDGIPADDQFCQPIPELDEYLVVIEVNTTDVVQLRNTLNNISFPLQINTQLSILDVNVTTVCSQDDAGIQCRCEEDYLWPCDRCATHGRCNGASNYTCGCIRAFPTDGQYCESIHHQMCPVTPTPTTAPAVVYEYITTVELNVTDVTLINQVRTILRNTSYPVSINSVIQITDINFSTACYPSSGGYQCRCEDEYRWSCDQCLTHGSCDSITNDTCGCINTIPPDGQFCRPANQHNFTACPLTTASPPPTTAAPPVLSEYIISVELNFTNVELLHQLRTTLENVRYPVSFNDHNLQISDISISTVCSPISGGYQCRCEDEYRWSCDQCLTHGSCDTITNDTCGCINTIPPDGRYCRPTHEHVTPCFYEYFISVELNTTSAAVINQLRTSLIDFIFPISLNENIKVTDVNISTVCSPSSSGYRCRCEDQYRWSCDHCDLYGSCDNSANDTCGCINAIPPDGTYCQLLSDVTCPSNDSTTTPTPTTATTNSTTVTTTDGNTTVTTTDGNTTVTTTDGNTTVTTTDGNTTVTTTDGNTTVTTMDGNTTVTTTDGNTTVTTTDGNTTVTTTDGNTTVTTTDGNTTVTLTPTAITNSTSVPTPTTTPNVTTVTIISTTSVTDSTTVPTPTTTPNVTTSSGVPSSSTPTPTVTTTSTTPTTASSTTSTTLTTPTPTPPVTGFDVEMLVELNDTFTEELNNPSSPIYRRLESRINSVLKEEYKRVTGFIKAFVTRFREGSIITEFVVQTTEVNPVEVARANRNLPASMRAIAPVIGSVAAFYNSPTPMSITSPPIYTGTSMKLTCEPPGNFNVGNVSASGWKFKGREIKESERIKITKFGRNYMLTVNNVILLDIGLYECTLTGGVITFIQRRDVTGNEVILAPNIRLQEQVNIKCEGTDGQKKSLQCCVQSTFTITWRRGSTVLPLAGTTNEDGSFCITYDYLLGDCSEATPIVFTCKVDDLDYQKTTAITTFTDDIICNDDTYGAGRAGDISMIACEKGQEGSKTAECQISGEWKFLRETCIVTKVKELLIDSEDLVVEEVPEFVGNLSATVKEEEEAVRNSSETISAVVDIINNVAAVSTDEVTETVMKDVLETVDVIVGDESRESWSLLNANETRNTSSELLGALESLSDRLVGEFSFATQLILLNRTTFNDSFMADLNNSIVIDIPDGDLANVFITTITFSTLNNVMPVRNSSTGLFNTTSNDTVIDNAINGVVVLVQINATIENVTLSYDKLNTSLSLNPQCVFWNFELFDGLGAWDDEGCVFVSDINDTVTCSCNHLTSFSILMATDIPNDFERTLSIITFIGVGISLASLVICLIIEGYVWKAITRNSTAFMRHVSIVNTALSLLIADICFIIASSVSKNPFENPEEEHIVPVGPCSTATFFMHFFYLAVFFWMLVSGLLLFYRTVMVFSHMSKSVMLAIGFLLGYGCPLIIAVVTVAATAPGNGYIRKDDICWLNWFETMALLAMVIPALTIVFINLLIVIVVLFKMLRRGVGDAAQTDEKHTFVVIVRCLVILTPLFGLTWALGVGVMISPTDRGIHIAFAFFNSLQGFFILVFGTLFDSKIRSILARKLPTSSTGSNNQTRSTSGGISSLSGLSWINRLRRRRNVYRVSEAANSSSNGASESFMNI